MQGKVANSAYPDRLPRITPACAGKSRVANHLIHRYEDHPCVCREKGVTLSEIDSVLGSPLRVQGKGVRSWEVIGADRITPACAGKSVKQNHVERFNKDHPCVCREKYLSLMSLVTVIGSPLRVQGKVFLLLSSTCVMGITPACAGKRS